MAHAATSRRRNVPGFGWLTKKKVTYRRHVGKERSALKREALAERRERLELKKLRAQELAADAAIAAAERRIAAAEQKITVAEKKAEKGGMTEARLAQIQAHMEREIESQRKHLAAILAKNPTLPVTYIVTRGGSISDGKLRGATIVLRTSDQSEAQRLVIDLKRAHPEERIGFGMGTKRNPDGCAHTLKFKVSDRAKRYRANQPGCKPAGVKKCKLCGSKHFLTVDHVDGNESNGKKSNLRWLCKSCNTLLGAEMARTGQGRRTVQYNPGGAKTLWEYTQAVLQHTRKAHDEAGRIIHETPKWKRQEYASQIWAARHARGTASPGSSSAGHDEPDWVSNPRKSGFSIPGAGKAASIRQRQRLNTACGPTTEYRLGYNLGQMDRQNAALPKTWAELEATFNANFPAGTRTSALPFFQAYQDGYGLGRTEGGERDAGGQRGENPRHETPFQYKGVTITPVPPTFVRYDVALPSGTIRVSSIQDAKNWVSRSLDPRFTHTARGNPDPKCPLCHKPIEPQHTAAHDRQGRLVHDYCQRTRGNPDTVYQTRAAAKSAWYDSAPGRNDRATFKKVRGGWIIKQASRWNPRSNWGYAVFYNKPGSAYLSQQQVAFYSTSAEAKGDAKGRNADLKASDPSAYYSGGQYTSRKAIRSENPSAHPNPETGDTEYRQAQKIAELFHGRPVKEEITVTESIREHDWLWRIGPLISLKIRTLTKRSASLPFAREGEAMVNLFCSPDGRQFYLRGGDQELDLQPLGMGPGTDWYRDQMVIGEAKEITYADKKKFHKFKLIEYYHKLGEKSKVKPMFAYDAFAHKMQIVGGHYKVETEDLVDGMSPGIVD